MNINSWNKETRQAYVGTLLYSILGVFATILTPFVKIGKTARVLSDFSGTSSGVGGGAGFLFSLVEICIIIGYIVFFLAIKDLKTITEGEDRKAFSRIYLSILFDILCAFFGMLHLGFVVGLFGLISCFMLVSAYSSLKISKNISEFSPSAISGFNLLFTAEILVLIAIFISWIPIIKIIGTVLKAIAWVLVLLGWKKVAFTVSVPGEESLEEKPILNSVKDILTDSFFEAKEVAKEAAAASKIIADELGNKVKEAGANIKERLDEAKENDTACSEDDPSKQ